MLKFSLKKSIMNEGYVPDSMFDWSLGLGEECAKINPDDCHSSISSCNIGETEEVNMDDDEAEDQLWYNMDRLESEYTWEKKTHHHLMEKAVPGDGQIYFKIPENFIKVGEF